MEGALCVFAQNFMELRGVYVSHFTLAQRLRNYRDCICSRVNENFWVDG